MRISLLELRKIIREVIAGEPTVLYHGTSVRNVDSILAAGLRAGGGWGGAAKPGVFLSPTPDDAMYWAKMSMLKKLGLPTEDSRLADIDDGEVAILQIDIPSDRSGDVVPRRKDFSLPGDVQFVGSVPPHWITLL